MPRTTRRKPTLNSFDRMYQEIRERICLLNYPPGTILREAGLAEEFGVSRTPVRAVLHRLRFEGLVETRNGVGNIVTGVVFASYRDVYELRMKVADLIGDMSPLPCSAEDVAVVEGLLRRAEVLRDSGDAEEFWRINNELQEEVSRHIGNTTLRWLHDLLYYQSSRIWFYFLHEMWDEEVDVLCSEIRQVLRAMRADDMTAVGYIRRNFISFGQKRVNRYLARKT